MPVYVYKNMVTGATFEVEQRITEEALVSDPNTGDPVKRIIQPVGIAFKGSGFYVNDSRGGRNGAAASKPAKDGDAAAAGSDAAKAKSGSDAGGSDAGKSSEAAKPAAAASSKPSASSSAG